MAPIKKKRQSRKARQKARAANGTQAKDRTKTGPTAGGRPPTPSMIRRDNNAHTREMMRIGGLTAALGHDYVRERLKLNNQRTASRSDLESPS